MSSHCKLAGLAHLPALETFDSIGERGKLRAIHLADSLAAQVQSSAIGLPENEVGLGSMVRAAGVVGRGITEQHFFDCFGAVFLFEQLNFRGAAGFISLKNSITPLI